LTDHERSVVIGLVCTGLPVTTEAAYFQALPSEPTFIRTITLSVFLSVPHTLTDMRCPPTGLTPLSGQRQVPAMFVCLALVYAYYANPLDLSLEYLAHPLFWLDDSEIILAFHSFLHFFARQSLVLAEQKFRAC